MVEGAFTHFYHEHKFEATDEGTLMTDTFEYSLPYGLAGKLFDWLILRRYMRRFLTKRNAVIKYRAESNEWKDILSSQNHKLYDWRPEDFLIVKKLFEQLWLASDNGRSPITSLGFHIFELSKSLGISKSLIYPFLKSMVDGGLITEVSEKPLLYSFTKEGIMIRSDRDIRNFLKDIGLNH